jgi:outer membrane biogenesis lipoprotein LolB
MNVTSTLAKMKQQITNLAIIITLMLAGCEESKNSSERYAMAEHQNDIEEIKQLATDWRSGWLSGDVDLFFPSIRMNPC